MMKNTLWYVNCEADTSEECLMDEELMSETVVGLESDSYTDGFSKVRSYYRYSDDDVSVLEK